jgi:ribosome-associated toxin RatA of RatAB toxin-antitoxin module
VGRRGRCRGRRASREERKRVKMISHGLPRLIAAAALVVASTILPARAQAMPIWGSSEEARLVNGEAVARIVEEAGPGGRVLAAIDIRAPASIVWRVMLDCARAPNYVPGLESCAILERAYDGLSDVREHRIRWIALLRTLRLRFRSTYDPERKISVERIEGDLAEMRGSWTLEPRGAYTRLHYDFHIAPRTPLPSGLIRAGMMRDAPKVLEAVRSEVARVAAE